MCRRWLVLSGPIVRLPVSASHQAMLAGEEPRNPTPAPARVILDVDPKTNGAVGVAGLRAEREHVGDLHLAVGEVVHGVGVVPEERGSPGRPWSIAASRRTVSSA